tara:strand:+ start:1768 stop:2142 length:375 start_codon:yes stop_codon:yes gene_type:complete
MPETQIRIRRPISDVPTVRRRHSANRGVLQIRAFDPCPALTGFSRHPEHCRMHAGTQQKQHKKPADRPRTPESAPESARGGNKQGEQQQHKGTTRHLAPVHPLCVALPVSPEASVTNFHPASCA